MKDKLKVAAYCRVSTDRDDQANSLNSQKSYFAEYIKLHENWTLVDIYYDEGISGTQTKNRVGFNQMFADAQYGKIDLILTKEVSRFARNTIDTLYYTRKLKELNVGVIFTLDNIDTRESDGELRLTIMASIAQEESRRTSERVKWGMKRRMEQGIVFGRDMLGYTVKNGKLSINEEEAEIVREVFHKFTDEGKGTYVIASELHEKGIQSKRGCIWSSTSILRLLKNEKYVGDLCQKKTITPDYLTHAKKYNRGEEEMIYIKDHHEPIISRDLWDRTQIELNKIEPTIEQKRKYGNRYWCSGKLYCGVCGARYVGKTKELHNGKTYRAWRCLVYTHHGRVDNQVDETKTCINGHTINDRILLTCVNYCIKQLQINYDSLRKEIESELKSIKSMPKSGVDIGYLKNKINNIECKKKKAIDLMLDGTISKSELKEQRDWYESQIADIEKSIKSIEAEQETRNSMYAKYITVLNEITKVDENNESVLSELLDKVIVYKDNTVDVFIRHVPFKMRLTYETHGRMETYETNIINMEIINKEGL